MSNLDFEPGNTVSHFRLEKKLGEGGMGAVYLAEDLTLSRKVAIKFMSRSLLAKQAKAQVREALEVRFIREAKSAGAINHPNLCQIYEANFDSDDWFIAMEFINGKDLVDITEDKEKFTPTEIVDVCRQTASGLKYAWDHYKIVHRDIKPRNIMMTEEGMVKIVDLGLAKPVAGPDDEDATMPDVTLAGTAIGTPQYMAPEQATGETNIDYMVDIYALGATLYEMCTGDKAFNQRTPTMIYMAQMAKKYKPIREFRTDLPDELISLIDDMLEPQRSERIESYDHILKRVRQIIGLEPAGLNGGNVSAGTMEVTQVAEPLFKDYSIDHLILGRYRVMKHLGKSRAGVVYKCIDSELGIECAVKSLAPGREFSPEDMAIVRDNYQRLMGLHDPDLVDIRDIRQEDPNSELFIVMEKLDGINFREYTHRLYTSENKINLATVMPVLRRIAKAIDRLNESMGSPHNDIKPESIFLMQDGADIKLLDFGVTVRPLSNTTVAASTSDYRVPLENTDYMAPEKWEHGVITHQADQYAFALVIYEMLGRRLPFWKYDPSNAPDTSTRNPSKLERVRFEKMRNQVLTETVPPIEGVDRNVNAVLLSALSKHPEERFANCQTFITRLSKAAGVRERSSIKSILAGVAIIAISVVAYFGFSHYQKVSTYQNYRKNYAAEAVIAKELSLSPERQANFLSGAEALCEEAERLQKQGLLDAANTKYSEAVIAVKDAVAKLKTSVSSEKKAAEKIEKEIEGRLKKIETDPLAADIRNFITEEVKTEKYADRLTAKWEECRLKITGAEQAIREKKSQKKKEADALRERVSNKIETLGSDPYASTVAAIITAMGNLTSAKKAADERHAKGDNWEEVIKGWEEVNNKAIALENKIKTTRSAHAVQAAAEKAKFEDLYKSISTKYGPLAPELLKPAKRAQEDALKRMLNKEHYAAIGEWQKALTVLESAEKDLMRESLRLEAELDRKRSDCLKNVERIRKHPLGDGLLVAVDPLVKKASALKKTNELKDAQKAWDEIAKQLRSADAELKNRVNYKIEQEKKQRVDRKKTITRIRNTYGRTYTRIKANKMSRGLLDKVPPPQKVFSDVPQDADDPQTEQKLLAAEALLVKADQELTKRIGAHAAEIQKRATEMLAAYEKNVEELLKNELAKDLVKVAEDHAENGRIAMKAEKYEMAIAKFLEAQESLKGAELALKRLMENKDELEKALKRQMEAKIKTKSEEYSNLRAGFAERDDLQKQLVEPDQKAELARAAADTGNYEGALKAWGEAVMLLNVVRKTDIDRWAAKLRTLSKSFAERKQQLAENPFAKAKLSLAEKHAQAAKALAEKTPRKAIDEWKLAHGSLDKIEGELQDDIKTQADRLRKEVLAMRKKVKQWEKWDPAVSEKLMKYDVTLATAREHAEREEYIEAGKLLVICKTILTDVEIFVKKTFMPKPGKDFTLGKVHLEFVWIKDMKLWVGKYEVTNAQYRMFKPKHNSKQHHKLSMNEDNQPVCWVSYFDAAAYCTWLNNGATVLGIMPKGYEFRLPDKKEWQFFASCGKPNQKYPWGDKWPPPNGNYANQEVFPKEWKLEGYTDDFMVTCPVAKSGKNAWGLYGTSGNLWEWTREKYSTKNAVFGGAWSSTNMKLMQIDLGKNNFADPQKDYDNVGFRILLAPKKE